MEISGVSNLTGVVANLNADNTAGVLMAKKAMDIQRQQGAANAELIASAGVDGKGTKVNTYA